MKARRNGVSMAKIINVGIESNQPSMKVMAAESEIM
jgi:hypothetical protein